MADISKQSALAFSAEPSQSTFNFGGHAIRVIVRDGAPWFVATDVCAALGYANTSKAVGDHLDPDEKGVTTGYTLGGEQRLTIISESGLYALVLRSRKPEARKFAKWVTAEVLPSIRKTGSYAKAAALPRLHLQMNPPARGTYKFNSANPYPRDGRTIEVAKSIITDIRNWSDSLPAGPARNDLHDAAQILHDLLVSGWTEVDEALSSLNTAMHYLNRWQGRGGGVGNVRSVSSVRVTR